MVRETFTSLKATHDAHRMAADILYQPLEFHEACPFCDQELKPRLSENNAAVCSACGTRVNVPAHILTAMLHEEAEHPREPIVIEQGKLVRAIGPDEIQRLRRILIMLFCVLIALSAIFWLTRLAPGAPISQTTQPAPQSIDWNRARELHQRDMRSEKLSAEERDYLQRAIAERQRGAMSNAPAAAAKLTPRESTGLIPLCDMQKGQKYKGETGGLYGDGQNTPPEILAKAASIAAANIKPLDDAGHSAPDGKIVLLSIGMSNTTQEFSRFKQIADRDSDKSRHLVIVDAAQGGRDSQAWAEQSSPRGRDTWKAMDDRLKTAGVSANQIQVVWLKQARIGPASLGEYPAHARKLEADINTIITELKKRFSNLHLIYLSGRIYAGYATTMLNPEPYAYESAFAVRWVIEDQLKDKPRNPVVLWGPYLWADGTKGRRADDLVWTRDDLRPTDGTHPSDSGREKVAQLLLKFFKTDPYAKTWFLRSGGEGQGN